MYLRGPDLFGIDVLFANFDSWHFVLPLDRNAINILAYTKKRGGEYEIKTSKAYMPYDCLFRMRLVTYEINAVDHILKHLNVIKNLCDIIEILSYTMNALESTIINN